MTLVDFNWLLNHSYELDNRNNSSDYSGGEGVERVKSRKSSLFLFHDIDGEEYC